MTVAPRSCLLRGVVRHHRLSPKRHRLTYRVFHLLLDLDDLPALEKNCRLFGWNRGGLVSFRDRDYGAGGAGLKDRITALCHAAGCPVTRVAILCFPRLWGYLFNPLSVYLCSDNAGHIRAVVYEVSNTFGQRHSYVFPNLSPEEGGAFSPPWVREKFLCLTLFTDGGGLLLSFVSALCGHQRPLAPVDWLSGVRGSPQCCFGGPSRTPERWGNRPRSHEPPRLDV